MKKIVSFSLGIFSGLGLLKIFSIIPFVRMAGDDYSYADVVLQKGFWTAQISWYQHWTGRFTSTFLQTLFSSILGGNGNTAVYSVITFLLLLFVLAVFYSRFLDLKINNYKVILLSCVSFVTLYIFTPNKNESWYWMTGSITYLWPVILSVFGLSYLFIEKPNKIGYLLSFLFIFFAVGGNETFALLTVIILGTLLLYSLIKRSFNKILLLMFLGSIVSFAVVFFAPGNSLRTAGGGSDPMSLFGSVIYSIQTGPGYFYLLFWKNIIFILPLFFLLSFLFSSSNKNQNLSLEDSLKQLFIVLSISILISIVYMMPSFKVLGRVPPDRSDITIAFLLLGDLIACSYIFKIKFSDFIIVLIFVSSILLFAVSFRVTSTLASDIYIAKNYSNAFDNMTLNLKNAKLLKQKGIVVVNQLPEPGLVGNADIKGYPAYEKNQAVATYYGLNSLISK